MLFFQLFNFDAFQSARSVAREKQLKNENLPLRKNEKQPKGKFSFSIKYRLDSVDCHCNLLF